MREKTGFIRISILFLCLLLFGGQKAAAAKKDSPLMKYRLYLGQSVRLTDYPEGKLRVSDENVIRISETGLVSAVSTGTADVLVASEESETVFCRFEVKKNELFEGLAFREDSYPPKAVGSGSFSVKPPAFDGLKCRWSSEDARIAIVNQNGVVTPVKSGKTYIDVTVEDWYGGVYSFRIPVRMLEPHFAKKTATLALGCQAEFPLQDIFNGAAQYGLSNSGVLSIRSQTASGVVLRAEKKGTAVITAYADGVKITCSITVTNPQLKSSYGFYEAKKSLTVKIAGTHRSSEIIWSSEDPKIASVKNNGKIRTKKKGSTVIICRADAKVLRYYLAVGSKKAVKAMRYGYRYLGKVHYSQARRMSKRYFDCSSFVYRCYRAAGKYLVRRASWAPVAADIAHYYVKKGKRIKTSKKYTKKQLLPGDLICYGGKKARRNGRYKRIYHIAMYIGNGKTLECSSTFDNVVIKNMVTWKKSAIPVVVRP